MIKYVNGIAVEMTAQEIAQREAEEQAVLACQVTETIKAQISALEAQITPRRIREALLTGDTTFIQNIENQITTLRNQL